MDTDNKQSKKSERRSWILFLLCVVLAQQLIYVSTARFATSEELIKIVAFGSTLMSIVLAVVAILYTLYQGEAQHSMSGRMYEKIGELASGTIALSHQVGALQETSRQMSTGNATLTQSLARLDQIVDSIVAMRQGTSEIASEIKKISTDFEELKRTSSSKAAPTTAAKSISVKTTTISFADLRFGGLRSLYILLKRDGQKLDAEAALELFKKIEAKDKGGAPTAFGEALKLGHLNGVIQVLEFFGLMTEKDDTLTLSPEFKSELDVLIRAIKASEGNERFKQVLSLVDECLP